MSNQNKFGHILFLDIETVPLKASFDELTEYEKELWSRKAEFLRKGESDSAATLYNRAGIYAEFGKVVCISTGVISEKDNQRQLRIKSFFGDDEKRLLNDFAGLVNHHFSKPSHQLCAHNGKEFDFPFLARRMLINGVKLPSILNTAGKKPWEVAHLDTMDIWRFGDYKSYTPVNLLAHVFGIPSPKDDIDGSMVWFVYWKEKNLNRIVEYCRKDTTTVAQVFLKLQGEECIEENSIISID
ncbi:MAG: 3'-5' exonuclease [Bacteroidia bacterium]|nr:3'-5' exonuclease [Bacteroidia bacterium]MCZ2276460.1 3'-5' exonuclease [Bacteroidia bacterium]